MSNLKAAVIGAGSMGQNHIRILRALRGVDLVAVVDPNLSLNSVTDSSIDELDVDYAVICVPIKDLHQVAMKCADKGVSALIEKPLASSLEQALEIEESFRKNNLFASVGLIERYNPIVKALKQMNLQFNEILTWRISPGEKQNDIKYDLLIHDIDIVRYLTNSEYNKINYKMGVYSGGMINGCRFRHVVNYENFSRDRILTVKSHNHKICADLISKTIKIDKDYFYDFSNEPESLLLEHEAFRDRILGISDSTVSVKEAISAIKVISNINVIE
jgi:UDP-N-acetylglucosamine 3-dehydrogenase